MLDDEKIIQLFDRFLDTYGETGEVVICIEEMAELSKELSKYIRYKNYQEKYESAVNAEKIDEIKNNIIEECADVLICASQIRHMFGEAAVDNVISKKLQKGEDRLEFNLKNSKSKQN